MLRPLTAALLAAALALGACGRDENGTPAADAPTDTTATATQPAGGNAPAEGCEPAQPPSPKGPGDLRAPRTGLDAGKRWTVALETNCGTIRIRLDVRENPKTTASLAALVRRGFYDGLTFHRVATQPDGTPFVIQGGDPSGDGSGGPGYSVVERPPRDTRYVRGVVAMAKTQLEDPGTSGSQFFIVTGRDAGLPPEYAVVGEVSGGMATVDRIAGVEVDPTSDQPVAPVVIEKATLSSS